MRRRSIGIDLTPLLDVLFVMLFMIIAVNQKRTEEAAADAARQVSDAQTEIEQMQQEYSKAEKDYRSQLAEHDEDMQMVSQLKSRLESYEQFDSFSEIVTVDIYGNDDSRTVRIFSKISSENISYSWDVLSQTGEKITEYLSQLSESRPENAVFVVFTYDKDEIYYRDYVMIENALENAQESCENIYIRFNEISEND